LLAPAGCFAPTLNPIAHIVQHPAETITVVHIPVNLKAFRGSLWKAIHHVARASKFFRPISQAEAARLRNPPLTRAAIRDLIRRRRLRSVKVGGRELVYRIEVLTFEKEKPRPKTNE